jgi:hypothetical protein
MATFRGQVLGRVKERYADFGPTLAAEPLASDDGLEMHGETLRHWMREAGYGNDGGGVSRIVNGEKQQPNRQKERSQP